MDTTAIKAQIKAGKAQPKHDQSGMTKLLVAIPLDLRTGLAELPAEFGVSQREIIRQAIRKLWEEDREPSRPTPGPARSRPPRPRRRP